MDSCTLGPHVHRPLLPGRVISGGRILVHHDKADGEGKPVPVRVVVEESLHDRAGHRLPVASIEPQHFSDSSPLARRYPKLPHEPSLFLFRMCHNFLL